MNIIAKRKRMDTKQAVQEIATFFAVVEKQQRKTIREARKLKEAFQAIHSNGDAGAMAVLTAYAELDAMFTRHHAETLRLHREQTIEADKLGIDAWPMDPDDEGDIVIMSGSGR